MAPWSSPAVARRWLAYELRRLREERGLAQKEVGKACGWSGVRVSYLEKWDHPQRIFDRDLDKLLPLYEVAHEARADFYTAAEASHEKGWWERYDDDIVPPFFSTFIGLEQGTSLIRGFEPMIVPGLLQTQDYMVEAIAAGLPRRTGRVVRQIIEVRLARQEVLTRSTEPAQFVVVVDESVLRRVVGGPKVMADQLSHVLHLTERPNVDLYVVPFERGISPGLAASSHRILHFSRSEPPIVYMEAKEGAQWIEDRPSVDQHDLAFEELMGASLTLSESTAMVREAASVYAARARIV
jgi:transcriptional regulator with XRE-family HTH domain